MAEDAKVEEKDNFDVGPLSVLQKCVKDNSQAWNIKAGKMFRFDLSSCTPTCVHRKNPFDWI